MLSRRFTMTIFAICVLTFETLSYADSTDRADAPPATTEATAPQADKAYSLGLSYTAQTSGLLSGGIEHKLNQAGNLLIDARLDLAQLASLSGTSLFVQGLATHGDSLARSVGDVQVSSNIDAPKAVRLYQAWVQKEFNDGALSVLAGYHDLNSEFYSTDASKLFANSSFGVGPELSHTGANGPSIFPESGMAIRARIRPMADWEISTALYDGVPGGTPLSSEDGGLAIAEMARNQKIGDFDGRYSIAAWTYTAQEHARGAYFMANQKLYSPSSRDPRGLSGFFRVGLSARGSIDHSWATGLNYTGLIQTRDEDQLGLAITQAKSANDLDLGPNLARETAIEFTYQTKVKQWFIVQPDLQVIINPGMNSTADNAVVGSLRLQVVL